MQEITSTRPTCVLITLASVCLSRRVVHLRPSADSRRGYLNTIWDNGVAPRVLVSIQPCCHKSCPETR